MTSDFTPKRSGYYRPQLSPEEYAEKKKAEKEAVYQLIDDTASEVVQSPEKFRGFLDTQSQMDRYSVANALLIYKQQPQAVQLKDFDDWRENNIKVNKGAKSVSILEPVEYTKNDGTTGISYNVKKVFDVSQTNGRRPIAPAVNRDTKNLAAVMLNTAPVEVASVDELPVPDGAGAFYSHEEQTLYIQRGIGNSVALCQCVAQELGHAALAMNSEAYDRKKMKFHAVCVGYMLCKKYGVDTRGFTIGRVPAAWKKKEPKEIRAELMITRDAMCEISSRISDELYRQNAERLNVRER